MRVELNAVGSVTEQRMWLQHQPFLMMALRTGSIEVGSRRSEMKRRTFGTGEMCLIPRHFESWVRTDDLHYLYLAVGISDVALAAACDRTTGDVELRRVENLVDPRVGALAAAVNAERVGGCFWIPSSWRLPSHWSTAMQCGTVLCRRAEAGWAPLACAGSKNS